MVKSPIRPHIPQFLVLIVKINVIVKLNIVGLNFKNVNDSTHFILKITNFLYIYVFGSKKTFMILLIIYYYFI